VLRPYKIGGEWLGMGCVAFKSRDLGSDRGYRVALEKGGQVEESSLVLIGADSLRALKTTGKWAFCMDNFEEIGRRIDAEMERLRRYVDEELAPETEKRTASFLRDVSGKLDQFAQKLEARMSRRSSPASPASASSSSSAENPPPPHNSQS
jgi:hypothetical protein